MKSLLCLALISLGFSAQATTSASQMILPVEAFTQQIQDQYHTLGLPWKVGETADYSIDMGFLKGTLKMEIRNEVPEGIWLVQDIDMMIQKQKVEMLFDKNTGEVKKVLVDGKESQLPEAGDTEVLEQKEDRVTVPAGTFDAIYVKARDNKQNQIVEFWINPVEIPIMGALKQKAESQFGPVVMELTSFRKL